MYKLTVEETTYTCPDESICLLAMTKAMDRNEQVNNTILVPQGAVEYLEQIGVKVEHETEET